MKKESRRLKRELSLLERHLRFLENSETRVRGIIGELGEFAGCNLYVNYSTLKMDVQDAVDYFYKTLRNQIASTITRTKTEYTDAVSKEKFINGGC